MPEQGRTTTDLPPLRPLLLLGLGFAVVGIALIVWGITTLGDPSNGGTPTSVLVIVAGAVGLGLGGWLVWGFGWIKRHPERAAMRQRQNASLDQVEAPRRERRNPPKKFG